MAFFFITMIFKFNVYYFSILVTFAKGFYMVLKLMNSLTGKKEAFVPLVPGKVSMYVCGVTPYDHAHVGHGRCYVTFDVLYRLLRFLEYHVVYCRNFTDI